jgi:hypothetical protein
MSDMPRIPREVIEHKLGIDPAFKPIKQKEIRYTLEMRETIHLKVNRLHEVGFIRPVDYPSWLANTVLVEKPDRSWRMCIDYTVLNKACPKCYHQIGLTIDDEEKTAFITLFGIFCYTKMAFGLKNGGATYQRCIHIVLECQIGRNVKAYIDDIVVKLKKHRDLLDNLKETFDNLRKSKMMLNPKKCVFGVSSGKLLGYMVSSQVIDADLKKVEAIENLQPPQTRKEIQKLAGMIAALSRFIS